MTDHKPNTFLGTKYTKAPTQLTRCQVVWQQLLSRFHYAWEYRKGVYYLADPLSRNPALYALHLRDAPTGPSQELQEKIQRAYLNDPALKR